MCLQFTAPRKQAELCGVKNHLLLVLEPWPPHGGGPLLATDKHLNEERKYGPSWQAVFILVSL